MEAFIADKKVLGTVILEDQKTPTQQAMVKVSFEDGTDEVMPQMRYELICTPEISDASSVQAKIKEKVGSTLFSVMHEYGVKFGEIEGVVDTCVNFANAGLEKATDILFKFPQAKLPLIEINNILLEHAKSKENDSDGASSTGSGTN